MTNADKIELTAEQVATLRRCFEDLKQLATCQVPSVRAAARVAAAEVHAALSGQGIDYQLYSNEWSSSSS